MKNKNKTQNKSFKTQNKSFKTQNIFFKTQNIFFITVIIIIFLIILKLFIPESVYYIIYKIIIPTAYCSGNEENPNTPDKILFNINNNMININNNIIKILDSKDMSDKILFTINNINNNMTEILNSKNMLSNTNISNILNSILPDFININEGVKQVLMISNILPDTYTSNIILDLFNINNNIIEMHTIYRDSIISQTNFTEMETDINFKDFELLKNQFLNKAEGRLYEKYKLEFYNNSVHGVEFTLKDKRVQKSTSTKVTKFMGLNPIIKRMRNHLCNNYDDLEKYLRESADISKGYKNTNISRGNPVYKHFETEIQAFYTNYSKYKKW